MKTFFGLLILFLAAGSVIDAAFASGGATLRGKVVDEDGKPVEGVEVRIRAQEGPVSLTHTDASGWFEFPASGPGEFRLTLNRSGFFRIADRPVQLKEGENEITFTVNHESEIQEEVQVYSSAESISPLETAHTDELIAREIRDIPVSSTHDLTNSLQVLPEVVRDHSGQLHVSGGRTGETQYLLDGFDIGDPVTGHLSVRVNVDSVLSAEVQSGRYGSQYGRAGAGVLAMDTAAGDDRWRAGATNFIPGVSLERGLHITSWYPRLTLSGPVKKGRAWFSEALSIQRTLSLVSELPADEDSVTQWAGDNMLRTQIRLTPKNLLQGSFLYNQINASNVGLGPFSPVSTTRGLRTYRNFFSLKEQVWSGRTFYELGVAADFARNESRPHGFEPYTLTPDGSSGNYFESLWQNTRRWQAVGSASMLGRRWHGSHDLQIGFNAAEIAWEQSALRTSIEVVRADASLAQHTEFFGPANFNLSDASIGIYGNDVWKISDALVVQLGLRGDWDRMIQRTTVSPRVSVNILPFKNEKTKLTAAWGVFLQPVTLSTLGPAYDQQRSDIFYGPPPDPTVTGPVLSRFDLPPEGLKQPRFYTTSLGWEQNIRDDTRIGFNFTHRNGRLGLAYENVSYAGESLFLLQNNRRDKYRSYQFSFSHSFTDKIALSATYTRSSTRSNHVFDYSLDTLVFTPQQSGPLDWDAPNRLVSSGWAPAPFWKLFVSYFFEYRTGYPFSIVNEQQQVVGPANGMRFPDYLSLNLGIEKRVHLFTRDWAIRLTILNVTSHGNPDSVINNIASPNFLEYAGGKKQSLTARIRLVG